VDRENGTNYQTVKKWMEQAGQDVPEYNIALRDKLYSLRRTLIEEEALECLTAFSDYNRQRCDKPTTVALMKELSDVLVVVYGAFVAMGVDGDTAFRIVMRNNFDKLEAHTFRGDGKVVVSPDKKEELKEAVLADLANLIK